MCNANEGNSKSYSLIKTATVDVNCNDWNFESGMTMPDHRQTDQCTEIKTYNSEPRNQVK